MQQSELILYACPTGTLAAQLDRYFQLSLRQCGANSAHAYMPHCTLTGFFRDTSTAIPLYVQALDTALRSVQPYPQPVLTVRKLTFNSDWQGLELESTWIRLLVGAFAKIADSPTRQANLRLKDWLHLSLAYDFLPEHSDSLMQLAQQTIDLNAPVRWELRLYQRHLDRTWTCHQSWFLDSGSQ